MSTLAACGSSSDAPAARVDRAPSHPRGPQPDADGWTHYELGPIWPDAPEAPQQSTPIPAGPTRITAYRERARAFGVPDGRGCTLHEVDLVRRTIGHEDETVRVRRMVLPAPEGAEHRFAIDRQTIVPITAMGPEIALVTACTEELDAREAGRDEPERCPLGDAWPALLPDGAALVDRYAALDDTLAQEAFAAVLREHSLEAAVVADWEHADDAAARRASTALHALDDRELMPDDSDGLSITLPSLHRPAEGLIDQIGSLLDHPRTSVVGAFADPLEAALDGLGDASLGVGISAERFDAEPHVQRAVRMGEAIVPTLIAALDDETTPSRTLYDNDMHFHVTIAPRREIVVAVLATILDIDAHVEPVAAGTIDESHRASVQARCDLVRTYWEAQHERTPIDRRWATLGDTRQSPRAWADAASWLVTRQSPARVDPLMLPLPDDSGTGPIRGEPLRSRTDLGETPTARMLARLDASLATGDEWTMDSSSCVLALSLLRWDPGTTAELDRRFDRIAARSSECVPPLLAGAADATAFVRWLGEHRAAFLGALSSSEDTWAPIVAHVQTFPAGHAALEALYGPSSDPMSIDDAAYAAVVPARLGIASARAYLLRLLASDARGGTLSPRGDEGWLETEGTSSAVPGLVTETREVPLREVVASQIAYELDLPFSLAADADTRNAQLAAIVAAVTAFGTPSTATQ